MTGAELNLDAIEAALAAKRSPDRLIAFTAILNEAVFGDAPIINGSSLSEDVDALCRLSAHAESLWNDALILLAADSFASAVFVAIVTVEEIGKVSVARFQVSVNELMRQSQGYVVGRRVRSPLHSHHKKHQLAAFSGLAVNARADRVLGVANVAALLDLAQDGLLEKVRQNSVYSSSNGKSVDLPEAHRTREDAVFFCTVAGELLAEIAGFEPSSFERLTRRLDEFERAWPLGRYVLQLKA